MNPNVDVIWNEAKEAHFKMVFPIHRACRDGDEKFLYDIFNNPENTSAKNHLILLDEYYGWTPSHWAAFFGKLECLRFVCTLHYNSFELTLKSDKLSQSCTHLAAFGSNPQCLTWLLEAGADANAQDYIEETPLHKSARIGSMECVQVLIQKNANVRAVNNQGQSAAIIARDNKHQGVAEYLFNLHNLDDPESQNVHTSSNGYYGFHLRHGPPTQEGMDTDSSNGQAVQIPNGFNQQSPFGQSNGFGQVNANTNGFVQQNGHSNGFGQINGHSNENQQNGFGQLNGNANGFAQQNVHISSHAQQNGQSNGVTQFGHAHAPFIFHNVNGTNMNGFQSKDVTLRNESITNITVGGRKRSREDVSIAPDGKRFRLKEPAFDTFTPTNNGTKVFPATNQILPSSEMETSSVDVSLINITSVSSQTQLKQNAGSGNMGSIMPICNNDFMPSGFRTYCSKSFGGHFF